GAYPELPDSFRHLINQLAESPISVEIQSNSEEPAVTVRLTRELVAARVHLMLYSPDLSSRLPFLIHEGAKGNFIPIANISEAFGRAVRDQIYFGMQLSVVCSEDIPAISDSDILEHTSGTFLGASQIRRFRAFCDEWPAARLPEEFWEPVYSDAQVLVISGDLDPATPPEFGEEVVRHLSAARHLILPNATHMINHPCINEITAGFIKKGSNKNLETTCIDEITRPPFFLPPDNH
ncbi:MAG: alpha/beta hydrolase, partial [Balneolaceae bacterium]